MARRADRTERTSQAVGEFPDYQAYLASPVWRAKRKRVMDRDNWRCACGARAEQVHHRSYAQIGREPLSDLIAVCDACHTQIHELCRRGASLKDATQQVVGAGKPSPKRKKHKRRREKLERKRREPNLPVLKVKRRKPAPHVKFRPNVGGGLPTKVYKADGTVVRHTDAAPIAGKPRRKKRATASNAPDGGPGRGSGSTRSPDSA